jgi:hypothetical protein
MVTKPGVGTKLGHETNPGNVVLATANFLGSQVYSLYAKLSASTMELIVTGLFPRRGCS